MSNPLIVRYREAHQRSQTNLIYAGVYLLCLILMLVWAAPDELRFAGAAYVRELTHRYSALLWVVEVALLIWMAGRTSMVIPQEIHARSYDFFRLIPLSPRQKALGILIGANLPLLVLLAATIALCTVTGLIAGRPLAEQLYLQILTLLGGTLLSTFALLGSTGVTSRLALRRAGAFRLVAIVIGATTVVPALIGLGFALGGSDRPSFFNHTIPVFGATTPMFVVIAIHLLYLSGATFLGCLRRMRVESGPLFTRKGALAFNLPLALSAVALSWPQEDTGTKAAELAFRLAAGWVALQCALTLLFSFQPASVYLDLQTRKGAPLSKLLLRHGNLTTGACLFLPLLGVLLWGWWVYSPPFAVWTEVTLVLLCGYLVANFLLEAHVLLSTVIKHSTLVIGFLLFTYLAFPAVAAASSKGAWLSWSAFDLYFALLTRPAESGSLVAGCLYAHLLYSLASMSYLRLGYRRLQRLARQVG